MNVFGVVHHTISKGAVSNAMHVAHEAGEHASKAVAGCSKCGPGSQRAKMSMRAWESQTASHTRKPPASNAKAS